MPDAVGQEGLHSAEYLRVKALAERGVASAQHSLGFMYVNGQGVPRNDALAVSWYRLAAGAGLAQAQYNLGVMYQKGQGVPADPAQAVAWYRQAAMRRPSTTWAGCMPRDWA
jgi:TPR repeat protein